ncbi:hypothetical protein N7450_007929 [Penicillium hetheringtonii]|uniref:Mediator of RNA polymerase II transcription subunit 5 n=1 Tax=Penicillium hetheringtonii TaxID=911720 RepID=A0AAD6DFE0_9EURO|nr:hypothetical protein N7450_007929 [Penicillium hetheringtonii]
MLPDEANSDRWRTFLHRCLSQRVDVDEFKGLSKLMLNRSPVKEDELLDLLLGARATSSVSWDPLLPVYVDGLFFDSHDRHKSHSRCYDGRLHWCHTRTITEAADLFAAAAGWIEAVVSWNNENLDIMQQASGLMSNPDAVSLFESVGILLAALFNTSKGIDALTSTWIDRAHQGLKVKLGQSITSYLPICVDVSLPLRHRLDALQKEFNLYGQQPSKNLGNSEIDGLNVNSLHFETSVIDGPIINTRAGLYVYLNSMLVGRPLVDDSVLINFLTNRYEDHQEILISEMITAAFDVLSNGVNRNESGRTMFLFRSFLVNKLPALFSAMTTASMVPIPIEMCITQALSRLDPNAFPSFSQMFSMQGSSILSDARQEFLFACANHRLIPESSIERLLGENPMQTLPVGGPYQKDDLVPQITTNLERADQLIGEIESMEGNAGAIVRAVTEGICNSLSRRPQALDVILLFRTAKQVLQPLCALLDSWRWDEEQGENQLVYDEFGSILLLVLAFKYRYDLSPSDIGISSNSSFLVQLFDRGVRSQKLSDLSEKQNRDLGSWITALFIAEGINEETMSSCSPQEFYLLVATLFDQSLGACESGKLDFDTVKGGFEYLLEPFLLPALVVGLGWLGNHLWESETDPAIPLKALLSLVKPSSISGEAQAIHKTVLNITARPLEEQLKDVRTRHQSRTDIKPILDALDPYLSFRRVGSSHRSELDNWAAQPAGGLPGSIRNTLQALVLWSTSSEMAMQPQSYTHRQILACIRILGSTRVLAALLDELKHQAETGNLDVALDIAATIVCAPMAESFAVDQNCCQPVDSTKEALPRCPILSLRDSLALQHDNVPKISEKDPVRAEMIVRLWRRVSVLAAPPSQVSNIDVSNIIQNMHLGGVDGQDRIDLEPTAGDVGDGGVGEDNSDNINDMLDKAAAAAAAGMDGGVGVGQDLGLGVGDTGMDTTGMDAIDDVLNAADMAVGNPEFLDLDMEGMF